MNRQYLLILQCLTALVCLTEACSNDTDMAKETVSFTPSVAEKTRATDILFETGDAISVFASTAPASSGWGNYADNVPYSYLNTQFVASGTGIEKPESDGIYYFAIYPYSANYNSEHFTFSVKENQAAAASYTLSDLMTATTETATTDRQVPLKFTHRLSKIVINMNGSDIPSGDITLKLVNVFTDVDADISKQTFIATGSKGSVTMAGNGTNSKKVILPPQNFAKGYTLCKLNAGDSEYDVSLSDDISLLPGVEKVLYLKKDGAGYTVGESQGSGNTGGEEVTGKFIGKWVEDTSYTSQENFAYEFKTDGTMDWFMYNWKKLEGQITATYTVSGDDIRITDTATGETEVMKITSVTDNSLVLSGPEGDVFSLTRVSVIGPS